MTRRKIPASTDGISGGSLKTPTRLPACPLMPHEARLALIRMPLPSVRIGTAKSWGGVNVGNAGCVPTEGHRTWQLSIADESYLRYGRGEDE